MPITQDGAFQELSWSLKIDRGGSLVKGAPIFTLEPDDVRVSGEPNGDWFQRYSDHRRSLAQNLALDAGVEGSYGAFSASASMSIEQNHSSSNHVARLDCEAKCVRYALHANGLLWTKPHAKLNPIWKDALLTWDPERIADEIGPFVARSCRLGGLYRQSFTMEVTESDDESSVKAEFAASYGIPGASAKCSTKTNTGSRSKRQDLKASISCHAEGGATNLWMGLKAHATNDEIAAVQDQWGSSITDDNLMAFNFKLVEIWKVIAPLDKSKAKAVEDCFKQQWRRDASMFVTTRFKQFDHFQLREGDYVIYNPNGNRHPNKFLHVRSDGDLQVYGPMDDEHRNDVNRRFRVRKHKVINGKGTYLIFNPTGNRRPNSFVHVLGGGGLSPYGPMDQEHVNDCNRHFAIEPVGKHGQHTTYTIYNPDGDRRPNSFWHVCSDGLVYPYGPIDQEHKQDVNRHFVFLPI